MSSQGSRARGCSPHRDWDQARGSTGSLSPWAAALPCRSGGSRATAEGSPCAQLGNAALRAPSARGRKRRGLMGPSCSQLDSLGPGQRILAGHGESVTWVASRAAASQHCRHCCREGSLLLKQYSCGETRGMV